VSRPKIVLCLGNPGARYSLTWHNAGFWTADVLAREAGVSFSNAGLFSAVELPCGLELAKPSTFMNESGRAASVLLRLRDLAPEELLVVCDEASLPLGRLRLRTNGSAGGHKGLRSIIASLGTDGFPRLRLGIGSAPGSRDLADHVLSRIPADLEEEAGIMAHRAADCVMKAFHDGIEAAQEVFNREST
jgi:PTH1 family peptidyl-tRNA hydrolase